MDRKLFKKVWKFIWEDDSIWSWIVNIALAFVLIKFIVYPGLGFILQTSHPVVAVVSESMEHRTVPSCVVHDNYNLLGLGIPYCSRYKNPMCGNVYDDQKSFDVDSYWGECGKWYETNAHIFKEDFTQYPLTNGFDKGDIMVLKGKPPADIKVGDVIVFWSTKKDPIIHRVVRKWKEQNVYYFQTKGDNNYGSIKTTELDETRISEEQIVGKAVFRIPLLGYIKIWFVEFFDFLRSMF